MKPDETVRLAEAVSVYDSLGRSSTTDVQTIARAILAAEQRERERCAELLRDPAAVRVNYLRGGIACQHLIDEAVAAGRERCAGIAETLGVYPELNVFNGGPEWYRHGKNIAIAIRKDTP